MKIVISTQYNAPIMKIIIDTNVSLSGGRPGFSRGPAKREDKKKNANK